MIMKYQEGDAALVLPQPMQIDEAADFADFFDTIEALSLVDETTGAVLAVWGFQKADENSAEAFALIGDLSMRWLKQLLCFLKSFIPQKMAELEVKVLSVTVKKNFKQGLKFVRLLGFDETETLENFYNGEDYQLFERRM